MTSALILEMQLTPGPTSLNGSDSRITSLAGHSKRFEPNVDASGCERRCSGHGGVDDLERHAAVAKLMADEA